MVININFTVTLQPYIPSNQIFMFFSRRHKILFQLTVNNQAKYGFISTITSHRDPRNVCDLLFGYLTVNFIPNFG